MKKTITVLMTVLITAMLFVSCGEDPFFHTVSIKDGEKVVKTEIVREGEEYTLPEKVDGIEGISGWTVDGKTYPVGEKIKVTSDITITAVAESKKKPETKTCKVTFDLNGGTGDIKAQTVKEGEKAAKPEKDPANLKGVFKFWSLDGTTEYKFDTAITADTTIKAVWKTTFEIGDKGPAGGIIFYVADADQTSPYVDESGKTVNYTWHYLEAASSDITKNIDGKETTNFIFGYYLEHRIQGGYNAKIATTANAYGNGTNAAIGQGRYNTTMLVKTMGDNAFTNVNGESGTSNYAAKLCTDYEGGGYKDWFLPSKDELHKMYTNLHQNKKGGFNLETYWSSSENDSGFAFGRNFELGYSSNTNRDYNGRVRPVRAF